MKVVAPILAVTLIAGMAQAALAECASGPEGNLCKAENGDRHAMYMVGREAYDAARETGDYSEAYRWASQSREAGVLGGKMLFKMIHLQAGQGLHHDPVEAHNWISTAIAEGEDYLMRWKVRLEAQMTPEQLAEVRRAEARRAEAD
jgi:hypothetical protein